MAKNLVVLTGAGISAESGLATFRGNGGLWHQHRVEDVATPEAFARNPELVHTFYNMRRQQLKEAHPNAAHHALARLAAAWRGDFLLVTQNVDDLHERALASCPPCAEENKREGRFRLLHMHGELKKARCGACEEVFAWEENLSTAHVCPACRLAGHMRPHIVWFGEMPLEMARIYAALRACDVFVSIGTSGNVYPAAGFVHEASGHGAHCVELNMERSLGASLFHEGRYGAATQRVPEWVEEMLRVA